MKPSVEPTVKFFFEIRTEKQSNLTLKVVAVRLASAYAVWI